jgi:hypothetical protein
MSTETPVSAYIFETRHDLGAGIESQRWDVADVAEARRVIEKEGAEHAQIWRDARLVLERVGGVWSEKGKR